jgi:hypothetical protein
MSTLAFNSALAVAAFLALAVGCEDPKPVPFPAHFNVVADEKAPVVGAQISARGQVVGSTNAEGTLQAPLLGFEGDRIPITLTCPSGYAASPAESVLILRSVQGLGGEERKPIEHALGCQPTKRDAVVLVHVSGAAASLPVKIDGAVVGQTDSLGFGHFYLRSDPGARFEVSVDTTAQPKLMPQNPQQVFQVETRDDVFVFDRDFKLPPKPKPVRRRAAKPAAEPELHIPIKLD